MNHTADQFADVRLTFWGALLVVVLLSWISYELNARFKMARTHAHFAEAVRIAEENVGLNASLAPTTTDNSKPENVNQPRSTGEWISLYNNKVKFAPGGGPAFIVNVQGNPATGAIGISATNYGTELHITRPAYRSLKTHKVVVTPSHMGTNRS